jgi:hypothetical protein
MDQEEPHNNVAVFRDRPQNEAGSSEMTQDCWRQNTEYNVEALYGRGRGNSDLPRFASLGYRSPYSQAAYGYTGNERVHGEVAATPKFTVNNHPPCTAAHQLHQPANTLLQHGYSTGQPANTPGQHFHPRRPGVYRTHPTSYSLGEPVCVTPQQPIQGYPTTAVSHSQYGNPVTTPRMQRENGSGNAGVSLDGTTSQSMFLGRLPPPDVASDSTPAVIPVTPQQRGSSYANEIHFTEPSTPQRPGVEITRRYRSGSNRLVRAPSTNGTTPCSNVMPASAPHMA